MARVKQRLESVQSQRKDIKVVKVQEPAKVLRLVEPLEIPELCLEERLGIMLQLRELFGVVQESEFAMVFAW